jgi:uncharacterized protein with ParB-like and HNH nuclease domain/predicted transport protein
MKATQAKFLEFLKRSPQFMVPIYQRAYSWAELECRQLWDDILRTGHNDRVPAHFVGSIVYVEEGLYHVTSQPPLLVIDGQQRLTTVILLIEAIARVVGETEPLDGFSAEKLRSYYLLNTLEKGDRRYKLILSQTDKASLMTLVNQQPPPHEHSLRIKENFELFQEWVNAKKADLSALCKGLAKLVIVDISLDRDQDNPQLIFESLNSTGRELTQADLIRNFVLMGQKPQQQTHLYEQYWRPMERDFGQEAYATHFDGFMRHYLTVRTGEIPNVGKVYDAFKQHARSPKGSDVEVLLADVRAFAGYFCAMALGAEKDPELNAAFHDIRDLGSTVAYPLLLELYHDYDKGLLQKDELLRVVRLVEGYVFRRAVCGIPTNSMNKTFATFARSLKKDRYLESIIATFLLLPSYRRFPLDDEFKRDLQTKDLYNFGSRSYWLRRLENQGRKERVPVDEYTIEHIMPQNENLSAQWQAELSAGSRGAPFDGSGVIGADWRTIQEIYLHTLGNLTLTGYNSEYSDRPFLEKRDMPGGFKESPLRLNQGLGNLNHWNEHTIRDRAAKLADQAALVWPAPSLEPSILETYRQKVRAAGYSIQDHPHLASGPMRELFEAFRKEVLALDPCVTEEILKLYVAYKAETNFVDVVPQAKRLRLSLNVAFHEIDDPRGICKDVSGIGRWGNGDVEVGLASIDEVPYVMGLVRQSFEKQMGSGSDG